jgi:pimeloyl-ACP methyl ester carboxylesterase
MQKKIKKGGFEERRFNTGEIDMNYVVGPNNGQALVLIPPQMVNWESYEPVLRRLSKKFQVYAIDIRGHGLSDWVVSRTLCI